MSIQVYSVIADHYREKKKEYHRKYSKSVSDQYANLVQEALNLKKYLKQVCVVDVQVHSYVLSLTDVFTNIHNTHLHSHTYSHPHKYKRMALL